jgi:hypothetical protein
MFKLSETLPKMQLEVGGALRFAVKSADNLPKVMRFD